MFGSFSKQTNLSRYSKSSHVDGKELLWQNKHQTYKLLFIPTTSSKSKNIEDHHDAMAKRKRNDASKSATQLRNARQRDEESGRVRKGREQRQVPWEPTTFIILGVITHILGV